MSHFDAWKSHPHVDRVSKSVPEPCVGKAWEAGALCGSPTGHLFDIKHPVGILSSAQPFIKGFLNVTFQFTSDLFYILM